MTSEISDSCASGITQNLINQMIQKMKSADTDGTKGLSKSELSSIDTGTDKLGSSFLDSLVKNFNTIDADNNGELSAAEMNCPKLLNQQMGLPSGMTIEDYFSEDGNDGTSGLSKDEFTAIEKSSTLNEAPFVSSLNFQLNEVATKYSTTLNNGSLGVTNMDEVEKAFTTMDTNKDGLVSINEFKLDSNTISATTTNPLENLADFFSKQLIAKYK